MDDNSKTTSSSTDAPSSETGYDDPGEAGGMVVAAASAEPEGEVTTETAPVKSKPAPTPEQVQLREMISKLESLTKQAEPKPVVPKFKTSLSIEQVDESIVNELNRLNDHYNDLVDSLVRKQQETEKTLAGVLGEQQVESESVELAALVGSLPGEHYQEIFTGTDGKRNLRAVAKEVRFLRGAYEAAGREMPSDRELFVDAAVTLFREQADQIREKLSTKRSPRAISRVASPPKGLNGDPRSMAIQAVRERMIEMGMNPGASEDDFDPGR